MLLFEVILLLLIIITLHIIKYKHPNFLFFCSGSILFMLPQQQQSQQKKKQKKQKQQPQLNFIQVQFQHVKQLPMADQYHRVIFLITTLVIFVPIKFGISFLADQVTDKPNTIPSSSFIFIISLVGLIYSIKIGLQIFWISSYNIQNCFIIAITLNIIFFIIYLTIPTSDQQLEWTLLDYRKQLSIIIGKLITGDFFNTKIIIAIILLINIAFTLISIPTIIKFGNWYTNTLKQMYYQDQQTQKITDLVLRKQKQEKQSLLKKKSTNTIRSLNIYLFSVILFIFFSHRYILTFLHPTTVTIIRIILMCIITFINCATLRDAIQFHGSFSYKYIGQYLNCKNPQQKQMLKQKITQYQLCIWYHKFQFMFRIIIPIFLFIMLIDWKLIHTTNPLSQPPIISLSNCGLSTNKLQILQNLYRCPSQNPLKIIHQISQPFINGILLTGQQISLNLPHLQQKINKFGFLNPNFMNQFIQGCIWYSNVTVYSMTIVYILFLRKSVYQI